MGRRFRHLAAVVLAVVMVFVVSGCAEPDSPPAASDPTSAEVCPQRLAQGEDPSGHGFGTSEPADSAPTLAIPEKAWICQYNPVDTHAGDDGAVLAWELDGPVRRVDPALVAALGQHLADLAPPEGDHVCTADLGSRLMLVYSHGTDRTGVVVDDYGCRDVRLTDDPFETPPGEPTSPGFVTGILAAPDGLIGDLRAAQESGSVESLVLGPQGVGPLRLAMTHHETAETDAATTHPGSRHDGWRRGCRVLEYDDRLGSTPDDTLHGVVSPKQGLELLAATDLMVTPHGIGLGSSVAEVGAALSRPGVREGDAVVVRASRRAIYRIQLEQVVVSIQLELRNLDCTI